MVESVLENPDVILMRQLDRIKREAIAEMKAAGMEYDQRMEELQKLEYPKPHKDFVYATFNDFVRVHPWVGADNIRPKSIAREAFENYASFSDYIKEYELQRSEGVLLRYLSDMYKTLVQTVPAAHRNAEVLEIIAYFRTMLKEVDSSLLDEWEKLHAAEEGDDDLPTLTAAQVGRGRGRRGARGPRRDAQPPRVYGHAAARAVQPRAGPRQRQLDRRRAHARPRRGGRPLERRGPRGGHARVLRRPRAAAGRPRGAVAAKHHRAGSSG
jgi:hypothetical protein